MSILERLQQFSEDYQKDYDSGIKPTFAAHFCELCYLTIYWKLLPTFSLVLGIEEGLSLQKFIFISVFYHDGPE